MEIKRKKSRERWAVIMAVVVGLFTLNLLASRHFARLDLTAQKIYTLSPATREILKNLNDVVTINVYFTSNLPPALANLRRDVEDILSEYKQSGGKNIKIEYINPQADPMQEQKIQMMGIPPIELNVLEKDKQELIKIYLGVTINYSSRQEVLAVVQNAGNLEYRLDAAMVRVMEPKKPEIGWWVDSPKAFSMAKERLSQRYTLHTIDEKSLDTLDPKNLPVLFFAVPEALSDAYKKAFSGYLDRGGKAIVLVEQATVAMEGGLRPALRANPLEDLLKKYGLTVGKDMVLDRSNATATFMGNAGNYILPYPFWVVIRPENFDKNQPMVSDLGGLMLAWPSSITMTDPTDKNIERAPLFKTTPYAVLTTAFGPQTFLTPQTANDILMAGDPTTVNLGVLVTKKIDDKTSAQLLLVSDSGFLKNTFLQQFPDNALFLENAVDVFSMGGQLIGVRSKGIVNAPVAMLPEGIRLWIKIVNIFISPVLLIAIGLWIWWRRKRKAKSL